MVNIDGENEMSAALNDVGATTGRRKVVVLWGVFGPYHYARIRALAKRVDLYAIQFAGVSRSHPWLSSDVACGANVITVGDGVREDQSQLRIAARVWRALDEIRPEFVLVPGYSSIPALSAALWTRTHRAVAILMSESNEDDHSRSWLRETLKRWVVRSLFRVAVVGGARAASYAQSLGIPLDGIGRYYDVVDNEFFSASSGRSRASCTLRNQRYPLDYILCVARLSSEKGLIGLVRSFAAYRRRGGVWDLVLMGNGPQENELRELVANMGMAGHVHFAGFMGDVELVAGYAFAKCFVLPSTREPWGLVVNEAMASGLPVLVSARCGCVDELVEPGRNGYVFDPTDEGKLAGLILSIAALPDKAREAMGHRSREIIVKYSPDAFATEVVRLIFTSPYL